MFSFGDWTLTRAETRVPWVLAAEVSGPASVTVLATCTTQKSGWPSYAKQTTETIDAYRDKLADGTAILAGDFNASPQTSDPTQHLANVAELDGLGLDDAYHLVEGIAHGENEPGTLFYQHKRDRPFHCDLAFVPRAWKDRIRSVEIGTYDDWVATRASDHVPVIVDIDP